MEGDNFGSEIFEGKRVSAHLEDLKYRQLQKLAKNLKLPSNMKKQYLLEVIQAKNAGNTPEIDVIIMRSKMEKMGSKPIKEKDKNKYKQLVNKLLTSSENKMLAIKPRPDRIAQHLNYSQVVVRRNEKPFNTITTRAKADALLSSASQYNQSDEIDSTVDGNNNDYLLTMNTEYPNYLSKVASSTKDSNFNTRDGVVREKRPERVLKSLLLAPDSTATEYERGISEMRPISQCDGFNKHVNYVKKPTPLSKKTLPQATSMLGNKSDCTSNQFDSVKGAIQYVSPVDKKCVRTLRYTQSMPNDAQQMKKNTVPAKKLYQKKLYEENVPEYNNIATNGKNILYPCQNSPNSSLELQREDSDYFIQEIGNSNSLNRCDLANTPFTVDSGITSDILIDSMENNDINLMADNFLLKDLVELEKESEMENENGQDDGPDDLSHLLPYMDGFDDFTDTPDVGDQLGTMDENISAKNDDGQNPSCLESLFSIDTDHLFQTSNYKVPENNVPHTDDNICAENIATNQTALFHDNHSELVPTTNGNTQSFPEKTSKMMSPNFLDKNQEISFPLILGYLQNSESEMKEPPMSPSHHTSDLSINAIDLDEDTLSLICHSNLMSDELVTEACDCFYCTWRGNSSGMDNHIRQYHNNYIYSASDTGSFEHTVSMRSMKNYPNQCLPIVILAYGTLLFLRVNHTGMAIMAHLSSIPSNWTDQQKMNGTIEIFSKDNYQSFLWTGSIQRINNCGSYFNFPTENCLKVQLPDIGYTCTNIEEENENSTSETAESDINFRFRIKVDCIY